MISTSWKPMCPNHGEVLEGLPFPLPKKGVGICPVSGCPFEFEAETDDQKLVQDASGNISKAKGWKVSGDEQTQPAKSTSSTAPAGGGYLSMQTLQGAILAMSSVRSSRGRNFSHRGEGFYVEDNPLDLTYRILHLESRKSMVVSDTELMKYNLPYFFDKILARVPPPLPPQPRRNYYYAADFGIQTIAPGKVIPTAWYGDDKPTFGKKRRRSKYDSF